MSDVARRSREWPPVGSISVSTASRIMNEVANRPRMTPGDRSLFVRSHHPAIVRAVGWCVAAAFCTVGGALVVICMLSLGGIYVLGGLCGGGIALLYSRQPQYEGTFPKTAFIAGMAIGGAFISQLYYWELSDVARDSREYARLRYLWGAGHRAEVIRAFQAETVLPSGRSWRPPAK